MPGSLQSGQEGFAARRRDRLLPAHRDTASSPTKSAPDLERFHSQQRIAAAELFQHRGKSCMQLTAIYITCHISKIRYIHGQLHHDRQRKAKARGSLRQARSRLSCPLLLAVQERPPANQMLAFSWHLHSLGSARGADGVQCCAWP